MNSKNIFLILFISINFISCRFYSLSGVDVGKAETIQIDFFKNQAKLIEPTLSQKFTETLQNLFLTQTKLSLTNSKGDLYFSGEIVDYKITPISGNANNKASQNRLLIVINVQFENNLDEKKSFEKQFSFYSDFDAQSQLSGNVLENALQEINNRISQDVFNLAVANNF